MNNRPVVPPAEKTDGLLASYVVGFVLSLVTTLTAYGIVVKHWLTGNGLVLALLSLALAQFVVQLLFFLHVGRETKPRWRFIMLLLALLVVLIVVLGSIWIMYNLNYRMMPGEMEEYLRQQDGL